MKYFAIALFFICSSCKNVTNTESGIDETVYQMWKSYTNANPNATAEEMPESLYFHDNKEDANRLAQLILKGKKKAGSSLYKLYEIYQADLPKVGTKQILTNFDGIAQAILETKKVDTIPFYKISKEYAALDMGTEIEPLKKWKKAHWSFFESVLKESGEKPTEAMLVVCESFEIIWTNKE